MADLQKEEETENSVYCPTSIESHIAPLIEGAVLAAHFFHAYFKVLAGFDL